MDDVTEARVVYALRTLIGVIWAVISFLTDGYYLDDLGDLFSKKNKVNSKV